MTDILVRVSDASAIVVRLLRAEGESKVIVLDAAFREQLVRTMDRARLHHVTGRPETDEQADAVIELLKGKEQA